MTKYQNIYEKYRLGDPLTDAEINFREELVVETDHVEASILSVRKVLVEWTTKTLNFHLEPDSVPVGTSTVLGGMR